MWDTLDRAVKAFYLIACFGLFLSIPFSGLAEPVSVSNWKRTDPTTTRAFFEITGSGERQNPLRRKLETPFSGDTIFVRFHLRYNKDSIDSALPDATNSGDGEFFVLWLDQAEGGEASAHSGGVPNIGIHVDENQRNAFMVRYDSSGENFGPPLIGDEQSVVIGRLSKSESGKESPFDELSLWVNPKPDAEKKPDAVSRNQRALSTVSWIGFSTGRKTESDDRILVGNLRLATSWSEILGEPAPAELSEIPKPPAFRPPSPPESMAEVDPQPGELETDHWSFQPITRPEIPSSSFQKWVRNPIDAFIARRHVEAGISPAPPASDSILARRISLILTGLPPDPEETEEDPDAFTDSLLQSTAYGERWGRHWLDVARWAESNGHQHNRSRENAWRYRDWVVRSFTENKPFDQFLRDQIAGDEIQPFSPEQLIATGFLAAARYSGNELDKEIQRNDILVDIVNTTSKAFLGLTMECAQCHDHFFDPITQWDYYNLMAYFAKGQPGDVILSPSDDPTKQLIEDRWGLFEAVRSRIVENRRKSGTPEPVLVIPKSVPGGMTAVEKRTFARISKEIDQLSSAWAFYSPVTSPHDLEWAPTTIRWPLPFQKESLQHISVRFLDRGEVTTPGPVAKPSRPLVFGSAEKESSTRLHLAEWLTSTENPLTARVWVNRIWQWYFGSGLVSTPGDFGLAGEAPSHPELLDWLASELIDSGWDTNHLHRLILASSTFRQSSEFSGEPAELDPENRLLWRWKPRRLEAEAIRDSVLAVSGSLDSTHGGPSVPIAASNGSARRSLYLFQRRDDLPHQQILFDGAGAITSCSKRRVSTVGLQPLWMLNSSFMQQQATVLAKRIEAATYPEDDPGSSARRLIRLVLHRKATPSEIHELSALIRETNLIDAVVVVLNTNEFLYIP